MSVKHDSITLGDLLTNSDRQKLVLPNFQREYVWVLDAQKRLLSSALADVPIGAVLLLEGRPEDYASRRVALMQDATPADECLYLLDGQQRLSTLTSIFSSPFRVDQPWKSTFDLLPAKLRYVWLLRVTTNLSDDPFGYANLSFPERVEAEPEDLLNFVVPMRILVKEENNDKSWYHPNWGVDKLVADRNSEIALAAANEGLVPLWALTSEAEQHLVSTSLQVIAGRRRGELQATFAHNKDSSLYESLRHADPTLPTAMDDATDDQVALAFHSLAERWRFATASFVTGALDRTTSVIRLQREDVGRAIAIFEVINQGGAPLTPFDLIVAKNAKHPQAKNLSQVLMRYLQDFQLGVTQSLWYEPGSPPSFQTWNIESRDLCVTEGSLTTAFKNAFLNLLSLRFHSDGGDPSKLEVTHIKRKAIVSVSPDGITANSETVAEALLRAWAFLQLRCGVVAESDLRYKLMILPIAYCIMYTEDAKRDRKFYDRLEFWYWTSLLGGVFRERQNENAVRELRTLYAWIAEGDSESRDKVAERLSKVLDTPGYSDRDALILKDQDSAISSDVSYGLLQYVLSLGPMDFDPEVSTRLFAWEDIELEDHHIVPLGSAATLTSSASQLRSRGDDFVLNSPLNRTLISRAANRKIGSKTPQQYWSDLAAHQPESHLLPETSKAYEFSLANDGVVPAEAISYLEQRFQRIREKVVLELHGLLNQD